MEAAAEAAAAKASARDHPDARRVEGRALAVQAMTDHAVTVLEQQLRPLITWKASEHSPRYSRNLSPTSPLSLADARGVRRISLSSSLSTSSSSGDYPKSPESPAPHVLGNEQQQRWVANAPEGSITAPLVAAAILLMERAWQRRHSLINSVTNLRERAVALAVAETSAAAGSPSVTGGDGWNTVAVAATDAVPINGNGSSRGPLASPPSSPSPFSVTDRQRFSVPAGAAKEVTAQATRESTPHTGGAGVATAAAPPPTNTGGFAGLSCCADFERILGKESDALLQGEVAPLVGDDRAAAIGSSAFRARGSLDKGKPLSDSSMIAERSFSGVDQHTGGGEVLHFSPSAMLPTTDTWPAVFQDVAIAEEQGREVVGTWEAAGEALKETCEDLTFVVVDHSLIGGLVAQ